MDPPWNHPGPTEPVGVWAVYISEEHPPKDVEPVEWMLLTRLPWIWQ